MDIPYLHNGLEPAMSFDGLEVLESELSWRGYASHLMLSSPERFSDVRLPLDSMPDFKWFENYYRSCIEDNEPMFTRFVMFTEAGFVGTIHLYRWKPETFVSLCPSSDGVGITFEHPGLLKAEEALKEDPLTEAMSWVSLAPRTRSEVLSMCGSDHWWRRAAIASGMTVSMIMDIGDGPVRRLAVDPDWRVRSWLARNYFVDDPVVIDALIHDADWRVRQGLCLGKHYTQGLLMAPLLEDPVFEVRLAAAEVMYHCCWPNEFAGAVTTILDSGCDDCIKEAVAMGAVSGE